MSLKERTETKTGAITAFLAAITLIGIIGLGVMLGGALTLTKEAHLGEEMIGLFMIFTFLIVALIEVFLVRQLSKLTGSTDQRHKEIHSGSGFSQELGPGQPRIYPELIPSVTENTTRTLEYSRKESQKQ